MGWCGGSDIFDAATDIVINHNIPIDDLEPIISILFDADWDTEYESKYWDHPEIGRLLGNDFEEEDDESFSKSIR